MNTLILHGVIFTLLAWIYGFSIATSNYPLFTMLGSIAVMLVTTPVVKKTASIIAQRRPNLSKRQHWVFWSILLTYLYCTWWAADSIKLSSFGSIIALGIGGSPVAAYGFKIGRYFANVRYRVGKKGESGDGQEDKWTVIVEKYWISFWDTPIFHIIRPFPAWETCVDCGGPNPGSVRSGERPLKSIATSEDKIYPIGHADVANKCAGEYFNSLVDIAVNAGIDITRTFGGAVATDYFSLSDTQKEKITRDEFMTLDGLILLEKSGLQF